MSPPRSSNVVWHPAGTDRAERWRLLGGPGATLWFTGLSGSGKSSVAVALETALLQRRRYAYRLDGDNIRHGLNGDLGFSAAERVENIRRVGEAALLFADSGCIALASFISPFAADRQRCRQRHDDAGLAFLEVFVDAPLALCEQRDPKGLYARARAGEITDFTGIDAPYEPPAAPALHLRTDALELAGCVQACLELLMRRRILAQP